MDRLDRQMGKVHDELAALHEEMATKADDYQLGTSPDEGQRTRRADDFP